MTLTALWRIGLVVAGAGALQACQSTPPTSSIAQLYQRPAEIGRASCRERVFSSV